MDYIDFGLKARDLRKKCGYTREKVKNHTGISVETLRRLEEGIPEPRLSSLNALSNLYKYDLVELFIQTRTHHSFFSDSFMKAVNAKLRDVDYEGLRVLIDELLNSLIEPEPDIDSKKNPRTHQYLKEFLAAFKALKLKDTKDIQVTIITLENMLLALGRDQSTILNDPYLYPIEFYCAIYLMANYRRCEQNEKVISLAYRLIETLEHYPYLNCKQKDHMGALYLVITYSMHALQQHQEVIDLVDTAFKCDAITFSNTLYTDLLMRKAIAYHHLGKREAYDYFTVALLNAQESRRIHYESVIKDQYQISHHLLA